MKHYYSQEKDALDLLTGNGLPQKVVLHCKAVADTCGAMARELNKNGFKVDERLCVRAGLLHDIERIKPHHEVAGAELLEALGYSREAAIVREHMGGDIDYSAVSEKEIVFLADKITAEHHRTTVQERYAHALEMTKDKPEIHKVIEEVARNVSSMEALYESYIGFPLIQLPIGLSESRFLWNDESIEWLRSAAEYSGYYRQLANLIRQILPYRPVIVEPGCGAGFLTAELAKFASRVYAVDIDERAVAEVSALELGNVETVCADAEDYRPDVQADAAVYCFYGGAREILDAVLNGGYPIVIAVGSYVDRHNFSESPRKRCFIELLDLFDREGVEYVLHKYDLDFSQPVKSVDEAMRFLSHYGPEASPDREETIRRLVSTDGKFPYIIPAQRNVGVAVIRRKEG